MQIAARCSIVRGAGDIGCGDIGRTDAAAGIPDNQANGAGLRSYTYLFHGLQLAGCHLCGVLDGDVQSRGDRRLDVAVLVEGDKEHGEPGCVATCRPCRPL